MKTARIDKALIESILPVTAKGDFVCLSLGHIGFVAHHHDSMLVFCESAKYLDDLNIGHIVAVLTTEELAAEVERRGKVPIVSANPKADFQALRDHVARSNYVRFPTRIHPSATISPRASVSEHNVIIGKNARIEANVTILEGVEIGSECFIGAGTVLGTAFDSKLCGDVITKNLHDGKLVIGNDVEIHSNCCIDKGTSFHGNTVIGNHCRISHLSYIGHSTTVGEYVFIMHQVAVAGGVTIGARARIDPGSNICSHITIGEGATVTTGSTVVRNVDPYSRVTGNFAMPHEEFKALCDAGNRFRREQ